MTPNSFASPTIGLAFIVLVSGACDTGGKPKTRDDTAADSALATDLALANRDTLLIDSIGQYRAAEGALADTGIGDTAKVKPKSTAPAPIKPPANPPSAPVAPVAPVSPRPQKSAPRLSAADKRLNGIYRALIVEMRRKENIGPGQGDPPSVVRLRTSQRTWMASRNTECRRRVRPRVRCLAEFSDKRANELADVFSRLTAR